MEKKNIRSCALCDLDELHTPLIYNGRNHQFLCARCVRDIIFTFSSHDNPEAHPFAKKVLAERDQDIDPKDVKTFLDRYVIGQEEAKKALAIAVFQHYQRIDTKEKTRLSEEWEDVEIEKSNVLIIGPTGVGKTLIVKTIAQLLHVPFAIADATVFTEAGYVGEDIESVLTRLLQVCDYKLVEAEKGIVYIDEIDKLSRKSGDNPSITKDVGGEGVQQGLLKLLEGAEVLVPPQGGRKHPEQAMIKMNTENILFICGGAFEGIERIIAKRMNRNAIGFKQGDTHRERKYWMPYVNTEDLRKYGMIPELLGRLPVITHLNPLDENALHTILTQPKNAILRQYEKMFKLSGKELRFEPKALQAIVRAALDLKTGARGLRGIVERVLRDAFFNVYGEEKNITITEDYVQECMKDIA